MHILVTKEEVEKIVLNYLIENGWPINKKAPVGIKTHREGSYEDSIEVFDGITVEII